MNEVKARFLLRQMYRKYRREADQTGCEKVAAILSSRDAVELFGEELFERTREIGDGTILERLKDIFEYIIEHQDEIMALVEMIIKIIGLFSAL